jgi:DNA-directed RNA polymerase specialized sigma24 family protein
VLLEPRSFEPDLLDRAEAVWLCKRLVETLPPDVMALVWRHYVVGVSWADLATELGVSSDTAKQRASRALRGARRRIDLSRD